MVFLRQDTVTDRDITGTADESLEVVLAQLGELRREIIANRAEFARLLAAAGVFYEAGRADEAQALPRPRRSRAPGARHLRLVKIAIIVTVGLAAVWGSAQYHPSGPVRHHAVSIEDRRARRMDTDVGRTRA